MKRTRRFVALVGLAGFVAVAGAGGGCVEVESSEESGGEGGEGEESGGEEVGEAELAADGACSDWIYARMAHSGLCLAPTSNSIMAPSPVGQYECVCPSNSKVSWLPIPIGSSPYLVILTTAHANANGQHMCVDRPNGSTATHLPLQSYPCHDGPAQQWFIRTGSRNGVRYWQYEAAWYNTPGQIVRSGKCMDIPNASMAIGTTFQLYPCKAADDPTLLNQAFVALW